MRNEIALNDNWTYIFVDNTNANYSDSTLDDSWWIPLPHLRDWVVSNSSQAGVDWFRRRVMIEGPAGSYRLCIDRVPESVSVYINGQHIGDVDHTGQFSVDVTHSIIPGENVITMKLTCLSNQGGGGFGEVRLHAVM